MGPSAARPAAGSNLSLSADVSSAAQLAAGPSEQVPVLLHAGTRIASGAARTIGYGSLQTVAPPADAGTASAPFGVVRMDLKDGSVSIWFTAPAGTNVSIAAVDPKGRPVLMVNSIPKAVPQPVAGGASAFILPRPQPPRVLLLTGPNQTVEIASGSDQSFHPNAASADTHGVWFAMPGSLWLYRQGALVKVADVPASLFRLPAPPPGAPSPPSATPPPPPGSAQAATLSPALPTGVTLTLAGPCQ